jgi:uncharacterized phage-associated protein
MSGPFNFDAEKATEALIYVARRVRDSDMYVTLKVIYCADKNHLHKYGRFVFGDTHGALTHGPVPLGAYAIVKGVRGDEDGLSFEAASAAMQMTGNTITVSRDADSDVFSATDLECLDQAIEEYGRLSFGQLKSRTHDDAYNATSAGAAIATAAIASMRKNPTALVQHLSDPSPDRL